MKRTVSGIVVATVVFCLLAISAAHAATTINFQVAFPRTGELGNACEFFAQKVDEYSKGDVKIKLYWPGQLVEGKEALAAMQRGAIGGYSGVLLYFAGQIPETNIDWFPYSWNGPLELMDIYYQRGMLDLLREAMAKHDVYYLAPVPTGSTAFMTNFPINKLEDLKGKKIRGTGIHGSIAHALGATPVNMPSPEQYVALQRGTIDGTLYPYVAIKIYKFYEVVKYVSLPGVQDPGNCVLTIAKKVWDGLTPDQKAVLERAGAETAWRGCLRGVIQDASTQDLCKEKGVNIIRLSPEEAKRMQDTLVGTLYAEHAKKSDICAKQVELLKNYWKEKGR